MTLTEIKNCPCGRIHRSSVNKLILGSGVLEQLPELVKPYAKPFLLADVHNYAAAGKRVAELLEEAGKPYSLHIFENEALKPDEETIGSAVMHFDHSCDAVIAVGSGVLNDTGKILAALAGKPYIIVGTAPSMDGYASASSSVERDGLKITLPSKCPDIVIGDTAILKDAPMRMLVSGLGDMLAKYISICEWRLSHIITGEYYCEAVAGMVRSALNKCVKHADGLLKRDESAVQAVFEGLVLGGAAMEYAGMSRPASGVEHYFSHIWDMRGLEFGTPVDLHGIQCAVGTLYAAEIYDFLRTYTPDKQKALDYVKRFDYEAYKEDLRTFLGKGAQAMIALEQKEQKYDVQKHAERLEIIIDRWPDIQKIIAEEVPHAEDIRALLRKIGAPERARDIGLDERDLPRVFHATKDIRDKYVLSRLCFDLGIIDEIKF